MDNEPIKTKVLPLVCTLCTARSRIIDTLLPVTCGYIAISNFIVEQKSFNAK